MPRILSLLCLTATLALSLAPALRADQKDKEDTSDRKSVV